jgi:hypothetical protein
VERLELLPDVGDLFLNAGELKLLLCLTAGFALCRVVERGVCRPARVLVALLDDAAELRSAKACYYGLIHNYRHSMK